ncbi:MAG: ATP-grasp domain-containing protein [Treponemataceae bacterium]|nr:MAG: ATP-grasp domain-containing protein [Treponemataceae bacterium]
MQEQILILGAALMQQKAIESAKELGFLVNVVDANENALCVHDADTFAKIDLKDRARVKEYALSLKKSSAGLQAVFTAGTDFSASVSYASEACALASHTFEAALNASDKIRMRKCFEKAGVASPRFNELTVGAQMDAAQKTALIADFAAKFSASSFPLVVKPADNMGARGCRMARTHAEFLESLAAAASSSRSGRVIIEEYMDGAEFSVDALVYDGTLTLCGFADRHIYYPPYFIEMGHTMPTNVEREVLLSLAETFARGVGALGLSHGAAKGDIKLATVKPAGGARGGQGKRPMIGEIAGRLSGGYMSGWTYPYASGCNLTKEAILLAAGRTPEYIEKNRVPLGITSGGFELFEVPSASTCAERAWISIPGKIAKISGVDAAKQGENVNDVFVRTQAGDAAVFPQNNVEKCGNVIATAGGREQAVQSAALAVQGIIMELEAHNSETDAFLGVDSAKAEAAWPDASERSVRRHNQPRVFACENSLRQGCRPDFPPPAFELPQYSADELDAWFALDAENAVIAKDACVAENIPLPLAGFAPNLVDWNTRSLLETVFLFDALRPTHAELDAKQFWHACLCGGLQGILYFADCMV